MSNVSALMLLEDTIVGRGMGQEAQVARVISSVISPA